MRSASQPPFRCDASASRVTGITLSPDVVPDVFTQSRHRPGHVTPDSPSSARCQSGSEMAVVADGNPLLVLRHRPDAAEAVGETELRIAGRRDQSPEHGLLDGRPVARHAAQLVPAPPGTPVEQRRRRARDHRPAPARRAGRSRARRVVSSQSATTRLKGTGRSSIGTWPQRARSQS